MNFYQNKKILVTGGSGHLGSTLIHCLTGQMQVDPKMIRVFYLANSPVGALSDIPGLEFFPGNILNAQEVEAACQGIDLVFHMVGSTTFDTRQKKIQWLINVEGTRNVLEACRKSTTIQKLCYTSTVNTLAVPNPVGSIGNFETSNPYTNTPSSHSFHSANETLKFIEDVHTNKIADWEKRIGIGYHDSKLAAQELVNDYVRRYHLNIVSILPGTMFGPYDHLIGNGMYVLSLYRNQMPAVLTGGLPLAHIMDVAEGHLLAMEKAKPGTQYILSGQPEDNRYLKDMAAIIVDVLKKKFPTKKFRAPGIVIPAWLGFTAGFFSEQYAKLFNKPMLLSTIAIRAGIYPLFYSSENAIHDLGYQPKRNFRQAVEDMVDYYEKEGLLDTEGRFIDRR